MLVATEWEFGRVSSIVVCYKTRYLRIADILDQSLVSAK